MHRISDITSPMATLPAASTCCWPTTTGGMAGERAQAHANREHVSGPAIKRQLSIYEAALARQPNAAAGHA